MLTKERNQKMTYVYDLLLNFNDENRFVEFYEWKEEDILEHIRKIMLFRISPKQMEEITHYQIQVESDFLKKIQGTSISYRNKKDMEYAALFSDLNKVVALEFDREGKIMSKSSLLLDEEEDIMEECTDLEEIQLTYKKLEKYSGDSFLTRNESMKKRYLIKEVEDLYKTKNIDKLTYLYEEMYGKDDLSFEEKYKRLKTEIEKEYSEKYNNLYDIVRLSYINKN